MQPKISVIIPCWHSTEYLDKLYENIQSQTFKEAEWIFVNDGDVSQKETLQSMAEKDPAIRVIWKENGGASSARNVGLEEARGEWIVFSDADDSFRSYYLESLYSAVKDSDADIAIGGYTEYNSTEKTYHPYLIDIEEDKISAMNLRSAMLTITRSTTLLTPWCKIYKASIIKDNNLRFDISLKVDEDAMFNMEYYYHSKKVQLIKDCGYIYIVIDTTSLTSIYQPKRGQNSLRLLYAYRKVLNKNNFTADETKRLMASMAVGEINAIIYNIFKRNHPPFRQAIKEIKEYALRNKELMNYFSDYKKFNKLSRGEKYRFFAMNTGSATIIFFMFKPVFWLRYKLPKFYVKLNSLFLRQKKQ